jgi:hypothetical protein
MLVEVVLFAMVVKEMFTSRRKAETQSLGSFLQSDRVLCYEKLGDVSTSVHINFEISIGVRKKVDSE